MTGFQDVFISYGRTDSKAFAVSLYERLTTEGLKVWFDFEDIPLGVDFQAQIDSDIEKAHNFLFIISPASVNSIYCRREIERAVKCNKRIIPLMHVEEISRATWQRRYPDGTDADWADYQAKGLHSYAVNMHPAVRGINWIPCGEGIDDIEQALSGLQEICDRDHAYVRQHTDLLVKALAWERHHRLSQYLLIGEERQQAESWLKVRFKDKQAPCAPTDLHCEFITESVKNANNLMTQVFLAHAEEDAAVMGKVRQSLHREGVTVWTSQTDIQTGEDFLQAIGRGIEEADNLVYLLSPNSLQSEYCQYELDYALSLNKRVIPMLVQATDTAQVPPELRDMQYIDLTDNVVEADYRLDESQLLKILGQDAAYHSEHKILLVKALKWDRQHRNPSILLRGYNLSHAETWLRTAKHRVQHPPLPLQNEFITESLRQPPVGSLDVFVSYSRADSDFARQVNDALQSQGKTTWFDQESIASGTDFQQEIYHGIESSDNFLFILSPRSVNSPYCVNEVDYAAKLNKRFVTVLHRQVELADLPSELAKVQWIDFNQQDGDFHANFNQLVRTLDTDRTYVHSHTKWSQQAIEWQQKNGSEDLLLRGGELAIATDWLQTAERTHKKPPATALQKAFIQASAALGDRLRQQESDRQQRELEQERKARKIAQLTTVIALAGGVVMTGFALFSGIVSRQTEIEHIQTLIALSDIRLESDSILEALTEGLRAGKTLQRSVWQKIWSDEGLWEEVRNQLIEIFYDPQELNRLSHQSQILSIAFSPKVGQLATLEDDGVVYLWNSNTGQKTAKLAGHQGAVLSMVYSFDGNQLATLENDGAVYLWNSQTGQKTAKLLSSQGQIRSVAFSPDGAQLITRGADGVARLWNNKGKELARLASDQFWVVSVAFSADGAQFVTSEWDGVVRLWNNSGQELAELNGHQVWVQSVTFSSDGSQLVTLSEDGMVRLWNNLGQELATLTDPQSAVLSVAFSPDSAQLVTLGADGAARLWNNSGQALTKLDHPGRIASVAFNPDGALLVTLGKDGTVRLWNNAGNQLATLTGHQGQILKVVFSPDKTKIATLGDDGVVRLWNYSGKALENYSLDAIGTSSMIFSPDSSQLATLDEDGTVRLWRIEGFDELIVQGCDWMQGYLAEDSALCDQIGPISGQTQATNLSPTRTFEIALFRGAINKASRAAQLTQTANTPEEWGTVVSLWQEAIDLLTVLKRSNPDHPTADKKIKVYLGNLQYAQQNEKGQKQAKIK